MDEDYTLWYGLLSNSVIHSILNYKIGPNKRMTNAGKYNSVDIEQKKSPRHHQTG